jgi:hypothetical protein
MSNKKRLPKAWPRCTSLCAGLGAALGISVAISPASAAPPSHGPKHVATSHAVTSCANDGPGSLRQVLADAATVSGDTIDLTPLKTVCSTITLNSEIAVPQDTLFLEGPGAKYLTIDAGQHSRVLDHTGMGTLAVSEITLSNGHYSNTTGGYSRGGCLYSVSSVSLIASVVANCSVQNSVKAVSGGGLFVKGNLTLLESIVTSNTATGDSVISSGGGIDVLGDLQALYSTINRNVADGTGNVSHSAGGIVARGNVTIQNSTISENRTNGQVGAIAIKSGNPQNLATISNSTISGNQAAQSGGIFAAIPTSLVNSTVAFNRGLPGIYLLNTSLSAQSSIIADNSYSNVSGDVSGAGTASVSGANDLIITSTLPLPLDTIQSCPKLDVLADNGGDTLTLGLKPTSPAIDKGDALATISKDQRLAPRVTGPQADIGAFEWQATDKPERFLASGFDGLCDQ